MAGNVAQDIATNTNVPANQFVRTFDSIAPNIAQITPINALTNDATPDYVFSSDEV